MMLNYELNPTNMPSGYREHNKFRNQQHLYKYLTIIMAVLVGIHFGFRGPFGGMHLLTLGLLTYAIYLQTRPPFAIRTAVRQQLKNKEIPVEVWLEATEFQISITTSKSQTTSLWECLVDYKICGEGILLYPMKNVFCWIPRTASIEGGTWQEFELLISQKIQCKI
jgi:hypothetical protein